MAFCQDTDKDVSMEIATANQMILEGTGVNPDKRNDLIDQLKTNGQIWSEYL